MSAAKRYNGTFFTLEEKSKILSSSLKSFGVVEADKSIQVDLIKRIFKHKSKEYIPRLLHFFLNSNGKDEFWYTQDNKQE